MKSTPRRVYLDHNATSPLRPEARLAVATAMESAPANPSSMHAEGRAARAVVESARERVARLLGTATNEVVFTSGGSESIGAAVRGVCDRAPAEKRRIVVSSVEHSAVLESAHIAARSGFTVEHVPCTREGRVEGSRFVERLGQDVVLAALQWANNETGVLQPVEEVGRACRKAGIPFLVDAVQAVGKVVVEPRRCYADLLAVSSHKLGGPQGIGALVVRDGIVLAPLIGGGAQERRRRAGTEAVAAIAGFGAAAAAATEGLGDEAERLLRLRARLETQLRRAYPEVRFYGEASSRLANTTCLSMPDVSGEVLAIALDLAGIAVSTGSACASGAVEPSHVLLAMGCSEQEARGGLRISMGWNTESTEIETLLETLETVVERARAGVVDPAP